MLDRFGTATAADFRRLAFLHDREVTTEVLDDLRRQPFQDLLGLTLRSAAAQQALNILDSSLAELPAVLDSERMDQFAADFTAIYLNSLLRAYPAESPWIVEDKLTHQEPMFQIRGWYQRYGLVVDDAQKRTEDHLVFQLQFLAHLFEHAGRDGTPGVELLREAARFLDEHLLLWIFDFSSRVAKRCTEQYHAGLVLVTAAYLDEVRDLLATFLDEPRPTAEEVEARRKKASTGAAAVSGATPDRPPV